MFNKIKDGFVRSGFAALLPGALAPSPATAELDAEEQVDAASSSPTPLERTAPRKPKILTPEHLGQVQWIAQAYAYKFTEREGNKGYTLDGHINGKLSKFERGYPSRNYIRGIELRARAELDLPPDVAFLLVNRTLKMDVHNRAQSGFADSTMASVDIQQPEEVLWMNLFSEVRIPHAPARFAADYAVLAEEEQHAQLICQPELMQLLLTWPRYDANRAVVLMLVRGKLYLRMRFIDDTFLLEHALQTFQTAAQLALQHAAAFKR